MAQNPFRYTCGNRFSDRIKGGHMEEGDVTREDGTKVRAIWTHPYKIKRVQETPFQKTIREETEKAKRKIIEKLETDLNAAFMYGIVVERPDVHDARTFLLTDRIRGLKDPKA